MTDVTQEQINNEITLKKLEALNPRPVTKEELKQEIKAELKAEMKISDAKEQKKSRIKDFFNRFYNNPARIKAVSIPSVVKSNLPAETSNKLPKERLAVFLPLIFTAILFLIAFAYLGLNDKFGTSIHNNITVTPAQVTQDNTFNNANTANIQAPITANITIPTTNNVTLVINIAELKVYTNNT